MHTEPKPATIQSAPRPVLTDYPLGSGCCGSASAIPIHDTITTRTDDFLAAVRAASPDQRLVFQLHGTPIVGPGYHVTEVKALAYETMDCGGVAARWQETVVQLWNPGDEADRGYMTVGKFLAIYERVAVHVTVSGETGLRFEYGDLNRPAVVYHVEGLENAGEDLLVHLRAPVVTCKARDRQSSAVARNQAGQEEHCCG